MYIAELRRLAALRRDHLDDTLRDCFVFGLHSENMQKQLLAEKELTLASALEKSQNLEAAHSNAQLLKGHTPTLTVRKVGDHKFSRGCNRMKTHEQSGRRSPCHRCGKIGPRPQECNFRDAECHNCGKIGHLAKVCRSSGGGRVNRTPQGGAKSAGKSPKRVDAVLPDNDAAVVGTESQPLQSHTTHKWEASHNAD